MSATTHDIFGVATRGEPATAGSHGERPAGFRLSDATRLGAVKLQTVIGHVHLHVGDLGTASRFYHAVLGFDRMVWSYPGALFLGAGGYHHHVGVNTWAGRGARPPAAEDARLLEGATELPDVATLDLAATSLGRAGHAVERDDTDSVAAHDPWGTVVRLRAPTA